MYTLAEILDTAPRKWLFAAAKLRNSAWWWTIPVYVEPKPVSGEFEAK